MYVYMYIKIYLLTILITHTRQYFCWSFSFVMTKKYNFYVICCYILDFCFRCYQCYIVSGIGQFLLIYSNLLYHIRPTRFKQNSLHFVNIKTSKFHCTDQLHFAEHLQSVPRVLRIPSIWILDTSTWSFLT